MYRDYNKYDVLLDGRIWSKKQKKFLKTQTVSGGYQMVGLYDNEGKQHFEMLHKVIYFAVNGLWEYPENMELHHLDENKRNNHISNLLLCTHQDNCNYGTRNSRAAKAISKALTNHPDKSKRVGAFKDDVLVMAFPSTMEAHRNGFYQGNVSACCRGKLKRYKGFSWKYLEGEEN